MTMNTSTVSLILTSSLISAAITSFVNWLIQRNNYTNDYHKKILDKRLQTYEIIENIIDSLNMLTQLEDGRVFHSILFNQEYYFKFLQITSPLNLKNLWLSNNLSDKLTEFSVFMIQEVGNEVDAKIDTPESEYHNIGVRIFGEIKKFKSDINDIFQEDVAELHKVNKFLNLKKQKNRPTFPLYSQEEYRKRNSN